MGKTRLSTHLALQLHGEGATVLYGRSDEDLGVPYQPWVQARSHRVKEASQPVIDAHVERFGGDLARLVPSLRERVPDLPSPRESEVTIGTRDPGQPELPAQALSSGIRLRPGAVGAALVCSHGLS